MNIPNAKTLDLLRRFKPTPLHSHFCVEGIHIRLETNDPEIIASVLEFGSPLSSDAPKPSVLWKLVRESECSDGGEFSILVMADLIVLMRGTGIIVTVDQGHREALGFLTADVSNEELKTVVFPFLAKWCGKAEISSL